MAFISLEKMHMYPIYVINLSAYSSHPSVTYCIVCNCIACNCIACNCIVCNCIVCNCIVCNCSYSHLSDDADHYFPPMSEVSSEVALHAPAEYSNFTFWREPLPEVKLDIE